MFPCSRVRGSIKAHSVPVIKVKPLSVTAEAKAEQETPLLLGIEMRMECNNTIVGEPCFVCAMPAKCQPAWIRGSRNPEARSATNWENFRDKDGSTVAFSSQEKSRSDLRLRTLLSLIGIVILSR